MTGSSLLFLLGYLNSKVSEYFFSKVGTTTGVGTVRWKKFTIEQLSVPKVSFAREKEYEKIVMEILQRRMRKEDYTNLAARLDKFIYEDLGLNYEEIAFIETQ